MQKNKRLTLCSQGEEHIKIKQDNKIISLSGGASYSFEIDKSEIGDLNDKILNLRFRGEPDLPNGYRNIAKYSNLYRRYSESLEDGELVARANGEGKRRALYYKVYGSETQGSTAFRFELEYKLNGDADKKEILIEVYHKGANKILGIDNPDQVINLDMPSSGDDYNQLVHNFRVKNDIDFIFIKIATTGLIGEFRMHSPRLFNAMQSNIVQPFEELPLSIKPSRYIAENYSRLEWLPFRIYINNTLISNRPSFDKAISFPSHEYPISIDYLHAGSNTITIEYSKAWREQRKFLLRDVSIVKRNNRGIVYAPDCVTQGKLAIVIKACDGDEVVCSTSIGEIILLDTPARYVRGLNIIEFMVVKPFSGEAAITVSIGGKVYVHKIDRYIEKQSDVLLSSGDSVFINRCDNDVEQYIEWYLANKVGNELLLRSSYAMTGDIDTKQTYWDKIISLYEALGMPYYSLTDGEELENIMKFNVDRTKNAHFGGFALKQMDKKYLERYTQDLSQEQAFYYEVLVKRANSLGINYKINLLRNKGKYTLNSTSAEKRCDLSISYGRYKEYLSEISKICGIHLGSTVHFKYLIDAGMKEVGAALGGSSYEPIIAALRGAKSLANGKNNRIYIDTKQYSHADTTEQYRRYLLSLYLAYIKGVDRITAESGMYCIESNKSDAERESKCCNALLKANQEFHRFITTHNRRGAFRANIALLQGKYDGATLTDSSAGFGEGSKSINYGLPERSWDMLRQVFYAGSIKENAWRRSFMNINMYSGYFSKTPYGEVNITPIESDIEELIKYQCLIMVGWNTADEAFAAKMSEYVQRGGTLVLSAPHLYTTTVRTQALTHISNIILNPDMQNLLGINELKRNGTVSLTTAHPTGLEFGANNTDIIYNKYGRGGVYFFTQFRYPCEISFSYRQLIKKIADKIGDEQSIWGRVQSKDWVSTAVFDAHDRRVIYMIDVKWWVRQKGDEKVKISFCNNDYHITIKRDVVNICSIFHDTAILTADDHTDIIGLEGGVLTLQGDGSTTISVLQGGTVQNMDITLKGITKVMLSK